MIYRTNILWIIPFASFLMGYISVGFIAKNKILRAPDVIGVTVDKALILLSQYNLNARVTSAKEDSELPEGTILWQTPAPGKAIKENQSLYLMITQKPPPIKIPNFQNKSPQEIQNMMETQSLQVKMHMIDYESLVECCIAQFPQSDNRPVDNTVIVYCSQSLSKPVIMPNFKNKNLDEVISFLSLHSNTPTILRDNSENSQSLILDQRPLPGSITNLTGPKKATIQLAI